jgi:hypothetical protein
MPGQIRRGGARLHTLIYSLIGACVLRGAFVSRFRGPQKATRSLLADESIPSRTFVNSASNFFFVIRLPFIRSRSPRNDFV